MTKISELFPEYVRLADGLRTGEIPSTPENEASHDRELAKYCANKSNQEHKVSYSGWWNLPVAKSCWHHDANCIERY